MIFHNCSQLPSVWWYPWLVSFCCVVEIRILDFWAPTLYLTWILDIESAVMSYLSYVCPNRSILRQTHIWKWQTRWLSIFFCFWGGGGKTTLMHQAVIVQREPWEHWTTQILYLQESPDIALFLSLRISETPGVLMSGLWNPSGTSRNIVGHSPENTVQTRV